MIVTLQHTGLGGRPTSLNILVDADMEPYYRDMVDTGCVAEIDSMSGDKVIVQIVDQALRVLDREVRPIVGPMYVSGAASQCLRDLLLREPWLGRDVQPPKPSIPVGDHLDAKPVLNHMIQQAAAELRMAEMRKELYKAFVNGLDIPAEFVQGLMRQIMEDNAAEDAAKDS